LLFTSCRFFESDKTSDEFDIPDSLLIDDEPLAVSADVVDDMVQNISSTIETAAIIKSLKIPFNKDYLAETRYSDQFNTNFRKALGLGIYGADLGYLNMYEKTSMVVDYISTIKSLADGIQVGQFFDFSTLKRLATNNENLDSLVFISQQSFNRIDTYLRETNRSSLSSVIVAGVWIEGLYLSTRVAQDVYNEKINETIGEQKVIISTLLLLLNNYKADPNIKALIADLEEIKVLYDQVKITIEVGETVPIEKDGVLTFQQNDVQTIHMSDELLKQIVAKVQNVRNRIIKGAN
jgi:hypothetical protein